MASLKPGDVQKAFVTKLGASEIRSGKHIKFRVYDTNGVFLGQTHISHGRDPIHDGLIRSMASQLGTTMPRLKSMIGCTIGKEEFLAELRRAR